MTITIRLKEQENQVLSRAARRFGKARTRSALIREAVVNYWKGKLAQDQRSPYDEIKESIGCYAGAPADLSERAHEYFLTTLHARRTRSR